ncbi:MAG: hypothetical protein ACLSF2_05320 [Butyricicoccus sp.]
MTFVGNDEVRQTDGEGFIRGDAVSLGALISTNYAKMAMATAVWRKADRRRRFHGRTV